MERAIDPYFIAYTLRECNCGVVQEALERGWRPSMKELREEVECQRDNLPEAFVAAEDDEDFLQQVIGLEPILEHLAGMFLE